MMNGTYHVFGVGVGSDDVRYVGYTQRSVDEEKDEILGDIMKGGLDWVRDADGARISIFEIESASSMEDARDGAIYWCQCFNWLGLQVNRALLPGEE